MPIRWDKRNKCWRFEFDRVIAGKRKRASKLLPRGWSQAKADAYDRQEAGRLYAVATGTAEADPLIESAIALYLADKKHLKSYRATLEHLGQIAWAYTGKRLSDLPAVAREINSDRAGVREGTTLSAATVRNRLAVLKAACRWAWKKHGVCQHDPTTRMQLPTVRNERDVYASREQMLRLARAADRHDVRVLIRAAFYTGMRLGELQRVEVGDGVLHLADTKNGERRSVPVHPAIATCLRYLPLTAPKITLQRGWQRARQRVGLLHIRLHDLRHSAASEMANADVQLHVIGEVLGHKDPRSTMRYAHLTAGKLADAVRKIGRKPPHKQGPKAA